MYICTWFRSSRNLNIFRIFALLLMKNLFLQSKALFSPLFNISARTIFKPPTNIPYLGIYRTNGEICRKDDLLVYQKSMNYHPGANVRWHSFNGRHMLKANCDGTVLITREDCNPDPNIKLMEDLYGFRNYENIYKLTFNVIPRKMSNTFSLLDEE
uniref:Uncharacterized protein n=1 Tax=Meloidogyne enterolobii TaxID=390850 RepID=A0A6V7UR04_MELEN|nr:unnamed protein product [Meloidogyne enterolobii]